MDIILIQLTVIYLASYLACYLFERLFSYVIEESRRHSINPVNFTIVLQRLDMQKLNYLINKSPIIIIIQFYNNNMYIETCHLIRI